MPNGHAGLDVRGQWILDGDARQHPLAVDAPTQSKFSLAQMLTRVDTDRLIGILQFNRMYLFTLLNRNRQ